MSGFNNSIVGGVGNLIRSWIQSVPFVSGSTGWRISKNGNAEFNNAVFRGTITITSSNDLLVYSTTAPTLDKLILAVAGSAGNDGLGNSWSQGLNIYDSNGIRIGIWNPVGGFTVTNDVSPGSLNILPTNTGTKSPRIYFRSGGGVSSTDAFIESSKQISNQDAWFLTGPVTAIDPDASWVDILLIGGSGPGVPGDATGTIRWLMNGGATILNVAQWSQHGLYGLAGNLIAPRPGITPASPEFFHTPALNAGWAIGDSSGTLQTLQYRKQADGSIGQNGSDGTALLIGSIHSTSATPTATILTLPSGYFIPAQPQRYSIVTQAGAVFTNDFFTIDGAGNLSLITNATSINVNLHFSHVILTG